MAQQHRHGRVEQARSSRGLSKATHTPIFPTPPHTLAHQPLTSSAVALCPMCRLLFSMDTLFAYERGERSWPRMQCSALPARHRTIHASLGPERCPRVLCRTYVFMGLRAVHESRGGGEPLRTEINRCHCVCIRGDSFLGCTSFIFPLTQTTNSERR